MLHSQHVNRFAVVFTTIAMIVDRWKLVACQYEYGYHSDSIQTGTYQQNSCELFSNGTIQIMSVAKFDKSPIAQAMTHELELIQIQFRTQQLWLAFNHNSRNVVHPFWAHFRNKHSDMIAEGANESVRHSSPTAGTYFDPRYGRVIVIPGLRTHYRNPHSLNSMVGLHFVVGKEVELFPANPEETILRPLKDNEIKLVLMNFVDLSERFFDHLVVLYAMRTVIVPVSVGQKTKGSYRTMILDVVLRNSTLIERNARYICMQTDNQTMSIFTYTLPAFNRSEYYSAPMCEEIDIDFAYIHQAYTYLVSYSSKMAYIISYNWLLSPAPHPVKQIKLNEFIGCKSSTISAISTFLPLAVFVMILLFCCCVCCSFISENQDGFMTGTD